MLDSYVTVRAWTPCAVGAEALEVFVEVCTARMTLRGAVTAEHLAAIIAASLRSCGCCGRTFRTPGRRNRAWQRRLARIREPPLRSARARARDIEVRHGTRRDSGSRRPCPAPASPPWPIQPSSRRDEIFYAEALRHCGAHLCSTRHPSSEQKCCALMRHSSLRSGRQVARSCTLVAGGMPRARSPAAALAEERLAARGRRALRRFAVGDGHGPRGHCGRRQRNGRGHGNDG